MNQNLAFLLQLDKYYHKDIDISLKTIVANFKQENSHFSIINNYVIQIHLYGNIVLPWEQLKKRLPKKIMMSEIDYKIWGYYKILNYSNHHALHKIDLRFFLRKLRNAISHNNIQIQEDYSVIFYDTDGYKIQYEWSQLLQLFAQLNILLNTRK